MFIVATNVVARRQPERRPTGTPHARANYQNLWALLCMLLVLSRHVCNHQKPEWLFFHNKQNLWALNFTLLVSSGHVCNHHSSFLRVLLFHNQQILRAFIYILVLRRHVTTLPLNDSFPQLAEPLGSHFTLLISGGHVCNHQTPGASFPKLAELMGFWLNVTGIKWTCL